MTEQDIITIVLDEAFHIHKKIGPGMLENVYKTCFCISTTKKEGYFLETEIAVSVYFEEVKMNCGYRADNPCRKKRVNHRDKNPLTLLVPSDSASVDQPSLF